MFTERRVYVGTVGEGIWRSADGCATFSRICSGMFMELDVRAIAVHPTDSQTLYAGTNAGLYRSSDGGERWERLETPFDPGQGWPAGVIIWSIAISPAAPNTLYVGTCPSALYRSDDGGTTWAAVDVGLNPDCAPIRYSRVTTILFDPEDARTVWAGVEIDGLYCTRDSGATWSKAGDGLSSSDIHCIAIVPGAAGIGRRILASTNNDLNISADDGASWRPLGARTLFPWAYCRGLAQKADDPATVFLGNGNGPPGSEGAIRISRDGGESWKAADLPVAPNSTVWTFAVTGSSPNDIVAATVGGQLLLSEDAGETWRESPRQFGEIRSLAIT